MKKIYAPWREDYITGTVHKTNEKRYNNDCIFCHQLEQNDDEKYFILKRFQHTFAMLNLYPYNGGHLMVLPLAHKPTLDACTQDERAEFIEVVNISNTILKEELKPQGFNIGFNIGKAGGGGIPSHIHCHVLPRWEGDTSFTTLLAETKPVSIDLVKLYKRLKTYFDK